MAKKKGTLYLESAHFGTKDVLKKNVLEKDIIKFINEWCRQNDFKSYYIRVWEKDGKKVHDFGSHSLYIVYEPDKEEHKE